MRLVSSLDDRAATSTTAWLVWERDLSLARYLTVSLSVLKLTVAMH